MFRRCHFWGRVLLLSFTLSMLPQAPAIAGYKVTDSASPASVQAGQTEQLTATVTSVNNHSGWSITSTVSFNGTQVATQSYKKLIFTGGVPVTETWNWPVPATATPGNYTFVASAFDEHGNFISSATTAFLVTAATNLVNGQCGSANGEVTNVPPTTNLCNAGTASAVTGAGPFAWSCAGSGGGTTASCYTAAAGFTVSDSASPASVQAGQTEQLTATVTSVYNHTGWSITSTVSFNGSQVATQSYTNLPFTGGVPVTEIWSWPVPATATPGTYTFVASAFDENGIFISSATTTFWSPRRRLSSTASAARPTER